MTRVKGSHSQTRPLWYWIAAVSAADAKIADRPTFDLVRLDDRGEYRTAVEAYHAAKTSLQTLATDD